MKNQNKPAYPLPSGAATDSRMGLTKREYFAAMAMQGLLANGEQLMSKEAVLEADALLAELEKTK